MIKITENLYHELKDLTRIYKISYIAKNYRVSDTTLYRIKKSKSFINYKNIALAESGTVIKNNPFWKFWAK